MQVKVYVVQVYAPLGPFTHYLHLVPITCPIPCLYTTLQARKTRRCLTVEVAKAVEERIGPVKWAAMSEEEREQVV